MTLNEYQRVVYKSYMGRELPEKEQLINNALGLVGEVGEIVDNIKKEVYLGRVLSKQELAEEFGDALWHLMVLAKVYGFEAEGVAEANIEKLQRRYPNAEW